MSYVLGPLPTNSRGASSYLNYDGITDMYFTSNSQVTPSPTGITLTYSITGGTATAYVANLAIQNTNSFDWSSNWIITWGMDQGETIKSATNCTATLVGRTIHVLKASGAAAITAGSTLNITVSLGGVTGSNYTTPLIFGFNGVIIRTQSPSYLSVVLAALPEGTDNSGSNKLSIKTLSLATGSGVGNTLCYVTFLNSSANMKNSFGYFSFPTSSTITSATQVTPIIVHPYLQVPASGGGVPQWTTIAIPYSVTTSGSIATPTSYLWPASTSIGFFVCADAWNTTTSSFNSSYNTWYSIPGMNARSEQHWASLVSGGGIQEGPNTITYTFEDTPLATADKDYNDGTLQIRFN